MTRLTIAQIEKIPLRALFRGYVEDSGLYAVAAKHLRVFPKREREGAIKFIGTERRFRENRGMAREENPAVWFVFERDAWRRAQAVFRASIVRIAGKASAQITEPEEGDVACMVIGPVPQDSISADLLRTDLARASIRAEERFEVLA